jgi:hypothetical protein
MRRIFWGFCINWFLMDPLHYLLSRSDFGFEFAEIFVIEKQLPDSASRQLSDSASQGISNSPTRQVGESTFECLKENLASRRVGDSLTGRVWELLTPRLGELLTPRLATPPTRRVGEWMTLRLAGESLWSTNSNFFKFIIELQHFKWLNQPFKGPIYPKISLGCNVLSSLFYLKV